MGFYFGTAETATRSANAAYFRFLVTACSTKQRATLDSSVTFWRTSSNGMGMILAVPRRLDKRSGWQGRRRGLPGERGGTEHSRRGRGTLCARGLGWCRWRSFPKAPKWGLSENVLKVFGKLQRCESRDLEMRFRLSFCTETGCFPKKNKLRRWSSVTN